MRLSKDGLLVYLTTKEWGDITPTLVSMGFRLGKSGHTLWSETRDRCLGERAARGYEYIVNPSVIGYLGIDPATLEVDSHA